MTLLSSSRLQDLTCRVLSNQDCGHGLKILRLQALESFAENFSCQPGQFVMLDLPLAEFNFRRPFSVLAVHPDGSFDVYYKIVGKGTRLIADLQPGDTLQSLGPLGVGFTPPVQPETALYVGGGIGIAPLYMLQNLVQAQGRGHCFYGVRGQAEIGLESELKQVFGEANLHISTDDGSAGFHGNVCQLLEKQPAMVQAAQEAYICGPTRMMEAACKLLHRMNPGLQIQVSLEEHMPCGTGACTGCVVPRADQYLPSKVCVEGPVFDARSIHWHGEWLPASAFCEESPCPL